MAEAARLTSRLIVDFLVRRVQQEGGFATMLQRGNDEAGGIVVECMDRGALTQILEKSSDFSGVSRWVSHEGGYVADAKELAAYRIRRMADDPDLWWLELDIAHAARFTDEILASH